MSEAILPEGVHRMRVVEVARRISKASGRPYWAVEFQNEDGANAWTFYSESRFAAWKVDQDTNGRGIAAIPDMLDKVYDVEVKHEIFQSELRMRVDIKHTGARCACCGRWNDHAA